MDFTKLNSDGINKKEKFSLLQLQFYGKFDSKNREISCKTSLLMFSGMLAIE